MWLKCAFVACLLFTGVAQANEPVVFVLAATEKVVVTNPKGQQQYSALPTQRLLHGHTIAVHLHRAYALVHMTLNHVD